MKEEFTVKAVGIRKDGYGCPVFAKVVSDTRLEPGAFRLLYTYTLFENMRGPVISPSVKLLMRLLNVSDRTIQRWTRQLEKCGYIKIEKRRGKTNIVWVDFDRGDSQARKVPWPRKEKEEGDLETKDTPDTSVTPVTDVTTPPTPVSPKKLNNRMSTKEKESEDNPLGVDYGKTKEKRKTAPNLVKLFYALIDKSWSNNGFKMGVGIVQNLIEKRYDVADIEGAIRWGVKEKGMMDLTELPMKVNWFIGNRKREVVKREQEMEELGPGGREILEEVGGM